MRQPRLPPADPQFFDPLLGQRCPDEECLHDGGDTGLTAGIDNEGRLGGVEPADTVAAYRDSQGRRQIAVSNRICLCTPRFGATRGEVSLGAYASAVGLNGTRGYERQVLAKGQVPPRQARQAEALVAFEGRQRPSGTQASETLDRVSRVEIISAQQVDIGVGKILGTEEANRLTGEERVRLTRQIELAKVLNQPFAGPRGTEQVWTGPAVVGRVQGLNIITTTQGTRDVTLNCNEAPIPPDRPMVLHKWADRQAAHQGDVVTFFLKYSNHGGRSITDVAVSDSLTGRLEYVPGSARSDRDAVFTTQQNEAGSVVLHWEISGSLLQGQSGVVSFQARVR